MRTLCQGHRPAGDGASPGTLGPAGLRNSLESAPRLVPAGLPLSTTSSNLPELRLRRGEDRRLRAGHLWVFSNEVDTAATPLTAFEPGQQARVVTDRGQPLGVAYVNPATLIAARLLTRDAETPVGRAWVLTRLRARPASSLQVSP